MRYRSLTFESADGFRSLQVMISDGVLEQMRGLLCRPPLRDGQGMLLPYCKMIHTFGMRYPIDVVYLSAQGAVLKVTRSLARRRVDGHLRAINVLELPSGACARFGIEVGIAISLHGTGVV